jgi:hypothetical protein
MSTSESFLIAMGIIFTIPYFWRIGRTNYLAPLVVVQILTGILLEPGILGASFPGYYAFIFKPAVMQSRNGMLTVPMVAPALKRMQSSIQKAA